MTVTRRLVLGAGLGAAGAIAPAYLRRGAALAQAIRASRPALRPLPVADATETNAFSLTAAPGSTEFFPGVASPTLGFDRSYLGPVIRLRTGQSVDATVANRTGDTITTHWHGLLVPGPVDGGPHVTVAPGTVWKPRLDIDQAPTTLWYHSHVHGQTAAQVYAGLAGGLIVTDGRDAERGLPATLGTDDLVLILQDKGFDRDGRLIPYRPAMPDLMHGFFGNRIVVNGQIGRAVTVPSGLVRLRLVNAANARNFLLSFEDRRPFHIIAADQGLLPEAIEVNAVRLAPAERVELLVDFGEHGAARLVSLPHSATAAGAMMPMMGGGDPFADPFAVLDFAVDPDLPALQSAVPVGFDVDLPPVDQPVRERSFVLNEMMMGGGMMGGGMGGRMGMGGDLFAINGQPYDMNRIDAEVAVGSTERWRVTSQGMAHPFHVHGVQFEVVSEGGRPPRTENLGIKDTVLVESEVELLVRFLRPAPPDKPYMFHCHILEHEDHGLMGQFVAA